MFNFQIESPSGNLGKPVPGTSAVTTEAVDLLRQLVEVQREQLAYMRSTSSAQDAGARWRSFLNRWQSEFPQLPQTCRKALPILEQSYGRLIAELTEYLSSNGDEALDNDFAMQEFLDRYGMRLGQLGTILNLVAPLAEAGAQGESSP